MRSLRVATRGSRLALWQTQHIIDQLDCHVDIVVTQTTGDRTQEQNIPIDAIRAQGVFVKEVQAAVLDGRADFAVHSAKDLPAVTAPGLVLACVPERGDPRDALVGSSLADLAPGATVATGSVRRRAQLAGLRPDLTFMNLRGNIDSRLEKARHYDAIVMAFAPLGRLQRDDVEAHVLSPKIMVPQVAQGALGIECRADDNEVLEALQRIEDAPSRRAVDAERSYLAALGGGCDLPTGAYATVTESGSLQMEALLASLDGRVVLRRSASGDDPVQLGSEISEQLLKRDGGAELLRAMRSEP